MARLPDPRTVLAGLDLPAASPIVAAVSGGGDSVALLLLLARSGRANSVIAITIDHALRPESADEAQRVAMFCRSLGVAHRIMRWEGDKPATGLMQAAREARYRLLAEGARDAGASVVLTGHNHDDRVETLLMRKRRGGAGTGLSAIAPATLYDQRVWFLRPLLAFRRAALRDWLSAEQVGWIDDPSNEADRFERVRIRRDVAAMPNAVFADASAQMVAAERERLARAAALAGLLARHVLAPLPGLFRLDPSFMRAEAAIELLRVLAGLAGGLPHWPAHEKAARLHEAIAAGRGGTLGRAQFDVRSAGIFIRRESRNMPALGPADGLWDGRFRLAAPVAAVAPWGRGAVAPTDLPDGVSPALARAALATLPCVAEDRASLVHAKLAEPALGPWSRFLPSWDFAAAAATARLFGADAPPLAPFGLNTALGDA
ncbi:MAG TPA: tRNA lysidine(34) synthetase TilS [Rhizobiaceae bacterium]|nr:tRNA lysidine(34) synthetase TilS [Rhizobiaceae bacterium]